MARTRSGPLGVRPKTRWNACWYSSTLAICATAASTFGCPISLGLTIGNPACSSSVLARPSQNCVLLYRAFRIVGALRWPTRPFMPTEVGFLSVKARSGLWQVLHETVLSADRRRSKKVSDRAKFFQDSADCPRKLHLESAPLPRQLVEATLAALRDPFLTLMVVSSSPF